ncbi:hypothetical protein BMJ34_26190 [Sinorhizobium medicae]|uniref:Uncharacterized protein n=1 Tax=Sinorhizobium medicae TaxID=110321 RepID=A0ABX4TNC5_9HYPH|nr:hypothetical protein BMJ34_26190 [Sinorhizobium medicae]PLU05075.1 hypothetical protein BMJ33_09325 [Sinorhizobium medicae]PLU09633.1 hypothetical protein BMJ30_35105 [Sinorhizobium medicae]PLU23090.1 hypothetical protein BMJ29_05515 [Sinorhizobium medicae]PLU34237.1 hypothetical protein BMJ27_14600 [Sinorhizobium medicae]
MEHRLLPMTCSLPSGKEAPGFGNVPAGADALGCRWRRTDVSVRERAAQEQIPPRTRRFVFKQISFRGRNFEARDRVDEGASAVNGAGRSQRTLSGT